MRIQKYSILFLFIFVGINWATAQTDEPLKREVEVIKEYQPSISDAKMITETPKIKDSVQAAPTFKYQIKSKPIQVEKSINTIAQVDFKEAINSKQGMGYLKAGFGNGFANFGEFVLNTKLSETSDFGIYLSHDYQYAKAKLISELNVKTPESAQKISLFGSNALKKQHINWQVAYDRSAYEYYGFFESDSAYVADFSSLLEGDAFTSQAINNFNATLNFKNTNSRSKIDYNLDLANDYLWTKTGQRNDHASLIGAVNYDKRDYLLGIDAELAYDYLDSVQNIYSLSEWTSHQTFKLFLTPRISFHGKGWSAQAGLNIGSVFSSDTSAVTHWSPNVKLQFVPIENVLTIFANVSGGLNTNEYSKAISHNPYQLQTLALIPTEQIISVNGGFRGTITDRISYVLDVDYSMYENFIQYYSNFNGYDVSSVEIADLSYFDNFFQANYIDLNILKFGGKVRYSTELLNVQLNANFMNYASTNQNQFSYLPKFKLGLDISTKINDELSVYMNTNVVGKQAGLAYYNTAMSSTMPREVYHEIPLKVDLNLGAKYEYKPNISFFFDVQNLINQNHQTWLGYVDPGMICTLGARFSF